MDNGVDSNDVLIKGKFRLCLVTVYLYPLF